MRAVYAAVSNVTAAACRVGSARQERFLWCKQYPCALAWSRARRAVPACRARVCGCVRVGSGGVVACGSVGMATGTGGYSVWSSGSPVMLHAYVISCLVVCGTGVGPCSLLLHIDLVLSGAPPIPILAGQKRIAQTQGGFQEPRGVVNSYSLLPQPRALAIHFAKSYSQAAGQGQGQSLK